MQEALTNAARHSGARRVAVALATDGAEVTGSVSDNGQGFDAAAVKRTGLGLVGMEERVRELGGSLRLVSSPGQGARVEFRLPCSANTPDRAEVAYAGEA